MRTSADFDSKASKHQGDDLAFAGLRFSRSALKSAMYVYQGQGSRTRRVEEIGSKISAASSQSDLLAFSENVCAWGRGQRVWANLKRLNSRQALAKKYAAWFEEARATKDDEQAIKSGNIIRGLGVSFASKHLRMLDPERYAVLDAVLSDGLGFALNPRGYRLFMTLLREFITLNKIEQTVATVEGGIFALVRQQVRAK